MYKFIFDSDALIKLTKSGILEKICHHHNCIITAEVKNECVDEGKTRLHQDASKIEDLINEKLLKTKNPKRQRIIKERLGRGEISTVNLYFQEKKSIIVTDDSAFIKYLQENNIRHILPANLVLLMKKSKKIEAEMALSYLENLREFIKDEVYENAKSDIMEED